jgi:hypothetical protein
MWSVWSVQNTERTVPSTHEIEIVLRNPQKKQDTLSYYIEFESTELNSRWLSALERNIINNLHLEKNYCFLGWAKSPRNVDFLCGEINQAIKQINTFNNTGEWQKKGLQPYEITEYFTKDFVMYNDKDHKVAATYEDMGLKLKNEPMNRLHLYFEQLQGESWELSPYYKFANNETKYAIRQLNVLCHELESWALSYRKTFTEPEWQRPSQITTFLNAPRIELHNEDYNLFLKNRYDRDFGGVYLHWAQIGKTHYEVFRDEDGADIDDATCSAISALKYYSGEFDVEWGNDIRNDSKVFHQQEMKQYQKWLQRNGFDWNDPKLSLGYIKLGQVNLLKSFGTEDFLKTIDIMSNYLDIVKIKTPNIEREYNYVWSDPNYKQMQIDFLRPSYDWSRNNA